jgi:hypothetical protein
VSLAGIRKEEADDKLKRREFKKQMLGTVYDLKSYVSSIKEDLKRIKMKSKDPKVVAQIKE